MSAHTEIEAKFYAEPDQQLPDLTGLVVREPATTELVAQYWDTADRRLDRWGVTLRRRVADAHDVQWTLKLPMRSSDPSVQHRREVNVGSADEHPPARLVDLVAALTRGASLEPTAMLRTDRRRVRIGADLWADAVELTDDRVSSEVAGRPGPSFRQIEVELVDPGAEPLLATVLDTLRDAGFEPSGHGSKLRQVLAGSNVPAAGTNDRPSDAPGDAPTPDGPIAQLVSGALHRGLDATVRADPWIRLDDDVEVVHTWRKAIRRLRSDLRSLRSTLDRDRSEHLRAELKWFAGLLGEVRDLHVLRQHLIDCAEQLDHQRTSTRRSSGCSRLSSTWSVPTC